MTSYPIKIDSVPHAMSPSLRHSVSTSSILIFTKQILAFLQLPIIFAALYKDKQILYHCVYHIQSNYLSCTHQFKKHNSFCKILKFVLLMYLIIKVFHKNYYDFWIGAHIEARRWFWLARIGGHSGNQEAPEIISRVSYLLCTPSLIGVELLRRPIPWHNLERMM